MTSSVVSTMQWDALPPSVSFVVGTNETTKKKFC
jgi:hypothetical protein